MKFIQILLSSVLICFGIISSQAQVLGNWATIDDGDGKEKSVVEIYEQQGKLFGKVVRLAPTVKNPNCVKCTGELKDKPLVGMVIIKDLTKTDNGGKDGKVLDPNNGKVYTCYIELVEPDKLKLRGYIGAPAFGRTQYWYRVN